MYSLLLWLTGLWLDFVPGGCQSDPNLIFLDMIGGQVKGRKLFYSQLSRSGAQLDLVRAEYGAVDFDSDKRSFFVKEHTGRLHKFLTKSTAERDRWLAALKSSEELGVKKNKKPAAAPQKAAAAAKPKTTTTSATSPSSGNAKRAAPQQAGGSKKAIQQKQLETTKTTAKSTSKPNREDHPKKPTTVSNQVPPTPTIQAKQPGAAANQPSPKQQTLKPTRGPKKQTLKTTPKKSSPAPNQMLPKAKIQAKEAGTAASKPSPKQQTLKATTEPKKPSPASNKTSPKAKIQAREVGTAASQPSPKQQTLKAKAVPSGQTGSNPPRTTKGATKTTSTSSQLQPTKSAKPVNASPGPPSQQKPRTKVGKQEHTGATVAPTKTGLPSPSSQERSESGSTAASAPKPALPSTAKQPAPVSTQKVQKNTQPQSHNSNSKQSSQAQQPENREQKQPEAQKTPKSEASSTVQPSWAELRAEAVTLVQQKKYQQAVGKVTRALAAGKSQHVLFALRAQAHIGTGNFKAALEDSESCIQAKPRWPRGYKRKSEALVALTDLTAAVATLKAGLEHAPDNQMLWEALHELELAHGDTEGVKEHSTATVSMAERKIDSQTQAKQGTDTAVGKSESSQPKSTDVSVPTAMAPNANSKPTSSGSNATSISDNAAPSSEPSWSQLRADAVLLVEQQSYVQAVEKLTAALAAGKSTHVLFALRSQAQLGAGNFPEAVADATACINAKPKWPRGYKRKSDALAALKDKSAAVAALEEGLRHAPNNQMLLDALQGFGAGHQVQPAEQQQGKAGTPGSGQPSASSVGASVSTGGASESSTGGSPLPVAASTDKMTGSGTKQSTEPAATTPPPVRHKVPEYDCITMVDLIPRLPSCTHCLPNAQCTGSRPA